MSRNGNNSLGDLESGEVDHLYDGPSVPAAPAATRSIYSMTREEIAKGLANRFVHSRAYIVLYLAMAALSVTTVVLSLIYACPTLAFYILELIINGAMIIEVAIRFVAFGNQFWTSPFNVMDLVITAFCVITLLVIFFAGCDPTSHNEELLDTLLLVARNTLQFGRLFMVMRQSGQSIFSRPKPIDLSRRGHTTLDIDMEDDEPEDELGQPLIRNPVVFDAGEERNHSRRASPSDMPRAAQAAQERDTEDVWAELG
ncbi:uncharacterized protein LAESUDRAFT_730217 [Laetiporus sulphureus 93-53]|uniref:Ion transport domain-containing protein n=1 Tax=Laetiporus sulphureus 93-53 TaxID=1314785 RepID=A0A165CAL7_9APHY|nr:uncharacterized protein LAESUDRAFT_730217 [Laetiporus sulphureus 93-53]KZT02468.1 hypothetical protein LAESUDRAFT_730217 [Laetiporus sulphureus 93-53]